MRVVVHSELDCHAPKRILAGSSQLYTLNTSCLQIRQRSSGQITASMGMDLDQQHMFIENLLSLQHRLSQEFGNLPMHFHPHCGSRIETLEEIEWLLDAADWLPIVFDTGCVAGCTLSAVDWLLLQASLLRDRRQGGFDAISH